MENKKSKQIQFTTRSLSSLSNAKSTTCGHEKKIFIVASDKRFDSIEPRSLEV